MKRKIKLPHASLSFLVSLCMPLLPAWSATYIYEGPGYEAVTYNGPDPHGVFRNFTIDMKLVVTLEFAEVLPSNLRAGYELGYDVHPSDLGLLKWHINDGLFTHEPGRSTYTNYGTAFHLESIATNSVGDIISWALDAYTYSILDQYWLYAYGDSATSVFDTHVQYSEEDAYSYNGNDPDNWFIWIERSSARSVLAGSWRRTDTPPVSAIPLPASGALLGAAIAAVPFLRRGRSGKAGSGLVLGHSG